MSKKIDQKLFSAHEHALEHEACPKCAETHQGELQLRHGKHGPFLGCTQYPHCDYIRPLHQNDGHIIKALGVECPECAKQAEGHDQLGELVLRQGRYGMFIGCSRFPECHHIESMDKPLTVEEKEAFPCPECGKGHLVERQSRFGKTFYACDNYPKCKFSLNAQPVVGECQECGFPLLIEKKNSAGSKIQCAERKCQHVQIL
ncbi:DNA topoisomerase family protein [Vibrio rumoiensis]|uniref:DNA topoisomerase n=1 Tax=Vibrio rumoiensis 1S-45 TaxID=1188252 RepID=A0A1E5E2Z2_9VIBR|nr:topoisomerase DNA-binding C4 zinc finger domain-containing protein [Vibrio rumoiensis]OEF26040.1 DNA topoisomerase [Vibrio rumoiensis 1S-45]